MNMNMYRSKASVALLLIAASSVHGFLTPSVPLTFRYSNFQNLKNHHSNQHANQQRLYMSNVGDGNNNNNNNNGQSGSGGLDDFLDPKKASEESDNLKRARAALSEDTLPINFGIDIDTAEDELEELEEPNNGFQEPGMENGETTSDTTGNSKMDSKVDEQQPGKLDMFSSNSNPSQSIKNNPYLKVVSKLSPSDLISKFTSTAHPRVQDAVRSTILGLIGTLPKMAFETTTITTGERLASLMFQLQMTGYMFKNAEYRLSLGQSLGIDRMEIIGGFLLEQGDGDLEDDLEDDFDLDLEDDLEDTDGPISSGKVRGKIKVRYERNVESGAESNQDEPSSEKEDKNDAPSSSPPAMEVEVDAAAYMAELRSEVAKLREDLTSTRQANEEAMRKDLLLYIRTLPQQELNTLTNTMSDDVLGAMKGLVNVVMGGIGEGQIDKNTVTEQSGEAMAQLCMWQLVVGYNLRELEVREEMKKVLSGGSLDSQGNDADDEEEGSVDYEKGGFE